MTTILAIDPSLGSTGIAHGNPHNGTPHTTTINTNPPTNEHRLLTIATKIRQLTRHTGAQIVALEDLAYGAKGSSLTALAGLHWIIRCTLAADQITPLVISTTAIKRYATGRGNTPKETVRDAARDRFQLPPGISGDICDALWLYALVADAHGTPIVTMPKTNRQAANNINLPPLDR